MSKTGTISYIKKYRGGMFVIDGDDGVNYFSHREKLTEKWKWKYCWHGNRVEFDVIDEGKAHLEAVNVKPVEEPDPLAEEKERKKEAARKAMEQKALRKQENIRKAVSQQERAEQKREYLKRYTRYAIQERVDGTWVIVKSVKLFTESEDANAVKKEMSAKNPDARYRIKKFLISWLNGKMVLNDFPGERRKTDD